MNKNILIKMFTYYSGEYSDEQIYCVKNKKNSLAAYSLDYFNSLIRLSRENNWIDNRKFRRFKI